MTSDIVELPDFPKHFHYLRSCACRYGEVLERNELMKLTRKDRKALQDVASEISYRNDRLYIESWICYQSAYGSTKASLLTYELMGLLDELGISTEDTGPKNEPEWTIQLWKTLYYRLFDQLVERTIALLGLESAFSLAVEALGRIPRKDLVHPGFPGKAALILRKK